MKEALNSWQPPKKWMKIKTIDMHTEGEPLRVLVDGLPAIKGQTILQKRKYFADHYDNLRKGLMFEPRGHADMYGAVLTEAVTPEGDFGVFFMHNEGYSTMCGHAIIALTRLVVETGIIRKNRGDFSLKIDAPPGRILASAHYDGDNVSGISFLNVPSFLLLRDQEVDVEGVGRVRYDVAFGGAFYAFCNARELGLGLEPGDYNRLINHGKAIKKAVMENVPVIHPLEKDLGFLYGTIFTGPAMDPQNHSRNVCIFAEGEVDRSPTGSGVSARAALHFARGEMEMNKRYTIESILGTTMGVEIVKQATCGPHNAVIPRVSGTANFTGMHEFMFDPDDPLKNGFIIR